MELGNGVIGLGKGMMGEWWDLTLLWFKKRILLLILLKMFLKNN